MVLPLLTGKCPGQRFLPPVRAPDRLLAPRWLLMRARFASPVKAFASGFVSVPLSVLVAEP
jgi:hypothetical protein